MTPWHYFRNARPLLMAFTVVALAVAVACSSDDDDPAPTQPASASATEAPSGSGGGAAEALAVGISETALGSHLVGPDGKTLYVFTRDVPDTSNCSGDCLQTWPPLLLSAGQSVVPVAGAGGAFDSIETSAGLQVTYNGAPLYYFAADASPGDTKGHLIGNVWFVARPDTASTVYLGIRDTFLIGPTGLTLYLFASDTEGVSNCSGQCLENWPALTVPEGLDPTASQEAGGGLDVVVRDDGARQITYNGLPLYYFAGDSLPGETNGDGVGGVWTLAMP